MSIRTKRLLGGAAAVGLVLGAGVVAVSSAAAEDEPGDTTDIQMLAFNDFHGALEPPEGSGGELVELDDNGDEHTVEAGGVEYLATHLDEAREGHDNSVTVAAGDLIGGSPFMSAAFHDEPSIESLNTLGMDVTSVGNHEFDEGFDELKRVQDGGCHPDDGCVDPDNPYEGADFPFLGANVVDEDSGMPVLPPAWVKKFDDGSKIGFIGMTLEGTDEIVSKDGIEGLDFEDEVESANYYSKLLEMVGVNGIVVLLHEGGLPESPAYNYDCNSSGSGAGISGPVVDIAENLDPQIDAVVSGHTHEAYDCSIDDPAGDPRLVTSGASNGRLITDITMTYDFEARDIVRTSMEATNRAVTRDVDPDPDQTALIDKYGELADPIADEPVGHIAEDIPQGEDRSVETPLGDLIADIQLAATAEGDAGAQIAFMNPGGIRADLLYEAGDDEGDGVVTYGEAFTVQPFSNYLVTMDLTGEQIVTLLQQQFSGSNAEENLMLQPSEGFTYTVDSSADGEDKVQADTVALDGEAIEADQVYRVTVNSFLAGGGDGFEVLTEGENAVDGGDDLEALKAWFAENSSESDPVEAPAADRVTVE
ncbi:MAG: bifunctional metallophosphatase/5'-nucleotidase [Stackebrandtia sp.]